MTSEEQKTESVKAFKATLSSGLNSGGKVILADAFSPAKINPVTGKWYFGVKCEKCNETTPMLPDLSNGQGGNPFTGPGKLIADCHYCLKEALAGSDQILSFQWA